YTRRFQDVKLARIYIDEIIERKNSYDDQTQSEMDDLPRGLAEVAESGKLAPRYVEPFEILEMIGSIACRLRLPEELSSVHDTFYVPNLKKSEMDDLPRGLAEVAESVRDAIGFEYCLASSSGWTK
nr:reverse transcriptase domain-containing protein [Tanacetum cinerariifolium]